MPKIDLNRVPMPKQEPHIRVKNFSEVALGYGWDEAKREASRCLQCPKRPCVAGCPVEIDIPGFIKAIAQEDLSLAIKIMKEKNSLPGICGRVCPQETQCEQVCVLAKKGAPIAIGRLERFIADWERKEGIPPPELPPPTGKKVAVVGSGPAGLTCASDLAKRGHQVTIFEALHIPGGVCIYGIPEFRLPKSILQAEVDYVKSLGVEIRTDWVVGKIITVDELLEQYNAVFLGDWGRSSSIFKHPWGEPNRYIPSMNS